LAYSVRWHEKALKDLKDLDRKDAKVIVERVKGWLADEPLSRGKPLKGLFERKFTLLECSI